MTLHLCPCSNGINVQYKKGNPNDNKYMEMYSTSMIIKINW